MLSFLGIPSTALREICFIREIQHENIIKLRDVHTQINAKGGYLHLVIMSLLRIPHPVQVFEYMDADLRQFMKRDPKKMRGKNLTNVGRMMARGLAHLHTHRLIHRDIKPQNVLISWDMQSVKIADFGLARAFSAPVRNYTHEVRVCDCVFIF